MKKIVKYLIPAFITMVLFLATSCESIRQVPVQTVDKIVYRDSLIYLKDTLIIEIPKEVIKEVVAQIDTSYLKTSLAESTAYVDTIKRKLHHTLIQKGEVKIQYDTIISVQYVDRIITKDVPIKVEVIKYKRDTFFWVLLGWALLCIGYAIIKLK